MPLTSHPFPEDVLVAVLHQVGPDVRMLDDTRLARIFNEAATKHSGIFRRFAWHPQYHYSKLLTDTLQVLDHGGSIIRDNPATLRFRISDHTAGPFGHSKLLKLPKGQQKVVKSIASRIKKTFGESNVPS